MTFFTRLGHFKWPLKVRYSKECKYILKSKVSVNYGILMPHSIKKAKRGRTLDQEKLASTGGIFANLKQTLGAPGLGAGASSSGQPSTSAKVSLGSSSLTSDPKAALGSLFGVKPSLGLSASAPGSSGLKITLGSDLAPSNGGMNFKLTTPTTSSGGGSFACEFVLELSF